MSKAIELLKRVLDTQHTLSVQIAYDIEYLLAQPEQTKQEPVAWMYDSYEDGRRERYDCLTTTEDYVTNYGVSNIRPLYTAPQKREPLSDAEILNLYQDFSKTTFVELVRQVEKAHGIGGNNE